MIRSYLFTAYNYLVMTILGLVFLIPVLIWNPLAAKVAEIWAWLVTKGLQTICGISVEVRGKEHLTGRPILFAMKHQSMYDTIGPLHMFLRKPAYVMKKELTKLPIFGIFSQLAGHIVVDREASSKALRQMLKQGKTHFEKGGDIIIFPEGTRVPVGERDSYKPGIAALYSRLETPCQPVATNSGQCWAFKGFSRVKGKIVFEILPPIEAGLNKQTLLERLENDIEAATNRLISEEEARRAGNTK